jgi:hypothetical protein
MTDNNTLVDNNIKAFDEPSRYLLSNHKVGSYQYFLKEEKEYSTGFHTESMTACSDRICIECRNDHSFRGNFEDAITSIDMLPALFEDGYRSNFRIIEKLQELVN